MVAIGDVEAELRDKTARREVSCWASAWWDLRTVAQILLERSQTEVKDANTLFFVRRSMLDGAIVAYARCFTGGARRDVIDLEPLVDQMGDRLGRFMTR